MLTAHTGRLAGTRYEPAIDQFMMAPVSGSYVFDSFSELSFMGKQREHTNLLPQSFAGPGSVFESLSRR